MFRIIKILLLFLSAYAIVTATPAQHQDMIKGVLAFKDAFLEACVREGSLCTLALEKVQTGLFSDRSNADSANSAELQKNYSTYSNSDTRSLSEGR